MVDVTHPEIRIPVVYVIVPGAHFLERTRQTNVIFHLAKLAGQYAIPDDALEALGRLNDQFPGRFDVLFFLGLTLDHLGRWAEALAAFEASLQAQPPAREIASVHVHIGSCRKDLGDFPGGHYGAVAGQVRQRSVKRSLSSSGILLFQTEGTSAGSGMF